MESIQIYPNDYVMIATTKQELTKKAIDTLKIGKYPWQTRLSWWGRHMIVASGHMTTLLMICNQLPAYITGLTLDRGSTLIDMGYSTMNAKDRFNGAT